MKKTAYILLCIYAIAVIIDIFVKRNPPRIYMTDRLPGNFNALTIPPFGIIVNRVHKDNNPLLQHEHIHWRQYQEMGLIGFYSGYWLENLINGYDGNIFEITARTNEGPYCRENYTECVRNGMSVTIYNPNFRKHKHTIATI